MIRDRTAGGMVAKASKGRIRRGQAPYGYTKDLEGGLRIVPEQARVVRRIYQERRRKRTLQAIADASTPTHPGPAWRSLGGVDGLLRHRHPKYRGAIEYLFRWSGLRRTCSPRAFTRAIVP